MLQYLHVHTCKYTSLNCFEKDENDLQQLKCNLPNDLEPGSCIFAISFIIGVACLLSSMLAGLLFSLSSSSCCCPSESLSHSFSEI